MGENFCQVAFGGGPLEEFDVALTRSEAHFTQAIDIGTAAGSSEIATAARAGRASVRAYLATYGLANWSDAAADAAAVTDNDFVYVAVYSKQDQDQSNYIMVAAPGLGTYRAHTVWATYYEDYFTTTGDSRTPWMIDPDEPVGDAAVSKFGGNVTFYPQAKYVVREAPINLSSGWEMRLIEAEAILNGAGSGDFNDAVDLMNQRRTDLSLTLITAASTAEAYTALKLERALELWLEGRRLGDIRRWDANSVSGGISDVTDGIYNGPGGTFNATLTTLAANDRCWPIGENERETNPNF
jgi:hypothetical protein